MVGLEGFRIFLNLDLKLKDLGLLGLLVVEALVTVLSLLENLERFLFREKDLMVGLGLGVVDRVSPVQEEPVQGRVHDLRRAGRLLQAAGELPLLGD